MSLLKRPPKCPYCRHRARMNGCICPIDSCHCTRGIYIPLPQRRRKKWWQ